MPSSGGEKSVNTKEEMSGDSNSPRKLLTSDLVLSLAEKENPAEVLCQHQELTGIGELKEVLSLRKVDISFNPISTLARIDQLKELRYLAAYCCRIVDADSIEGAKRIEHIMLQQNGLTSVPDCFTTFNKLKELRIDRNRIEKLQNLGGCTSLRVLDVSYNQLSSLEGLAGLQSLTELRATNNQLSTLKHLRALPNLREVNVSNNKLTDLRGLELLPSIQTVLAENNSISTIRIPQTYMSHLNKKLDKDGGGSIKVISKEVGDADSKTVPSQHSKPSKRSTTKSKLSKNRSEKSESKTENDASISSHNDKSVVGLQNLLELLLSGNKIESLDGLESYGTAIESIDVSNNQINDSKEFLLSKLSLLGNLEDLSISGNMIVDDCLDNGEEKMDAKSIDDSTIATCNTMIPTAKLLRKQSSTASKASLQENSLSVTRSKFENVPLRDALGLCCPSLVSLDGSPLQKGISNAPKDDGFHTWEDPSLILAQSDSKLDDSPGAETEEKLDDMEDDEPDFIKKRNPKLVVETLVSREEILLKENIFQGLLQKTKDAIKQAVKDNLPPGVTEEDATASTKTLSQDKNENENKPAVHVSQTLSVEEEDAQPDEIEKKHSQERKPLSNKEHAPNRKPAQLARNPSSKACTDNSKASEQADTSLRAFNRPSTPGKGPTIDRKIGSTKVMAVGADKPPPPVAQFDMRALAQNSFTANREIHSARAAENERIDDRRRINSARMESESRRTRMTSSSRTSVRRIDSKLNYMYKASQHDSESQPLAKSIDNVIHTLDVGGMDHGMRRVGSAPLSTIDSAMDDDQSMQWNLMPPSELPRHVIPPDTIESNNPEVPFGVDSGPTEYFIRNEPDSKRPSSASSGVSLTKFRVPLREEK